MEQTSGDLSRSFLSIPASILTDILCNWLELEEICKFDSAACESSLRRSYLQCVTSEHAVLDCYYDYEGYNEQNCIKWLILRGIKLSKFMLPAKFLDDVALLQRFLAQAGRAIKYIDTGMYFDSRTVGFVSVPRKPALEDVAAYCPNITQINQAGNVVDPALCPLLEKCTKVQDIYFQEAKVLGNAVLASICSSAGQLVSLTFNSCDFGDNSLLVNGKCSSLRKLEVSYSSLTSAQIAGMARMFPNVISITIGDVRGPDVAVIAQSCPHVTSFMADLITGLSDDDVLGFTAAWKNIEHLCLVYTPVTELTTLASEGSVLHIIRQCPKLVTLQIHCGHAVGDPYLYLHGDKVPIQAGIPSQLRTLVVDCLSMRAFDFVANHCPLVETLDVKRSDEGGALSAELISRSQIKTLNLGDSRLFSAYGVSDTFPRVREFTICKCEFAKIDQIVALLSRSAPYRVLLTHSRGAGGCSDIVQATKAHLVPLC